MHIGNPGNSAQLLQSLQSQSAQTITHENSNAFNKALQMQQAVTKPTPAPNGSTQLPGADGQVPGNGTQGAALHLAKQLARTLCKVRPLQRDLALLRPCLTPKVT